MSLAKTLKDIEIIRIMNLGYLHSKTGFYGAPTSLNLIKFLNNKGVAINGNDLTNIYQKKLTLSDALAASIEIAFKMPSGWLSEDHEFIYILTPKETELHKTLSKLPFEAKEIILQLVNHLAK